MFNFAVNDRSRSVQLTLRFGRGELEPPALSASQAPARAFPSDGREGPLTPAAGSDEPPHASCAVGRPLSRPLPSHSPGGLFPPPLCLNQDPGGSASATLSDFSVETRSLCSHVALARVTWYPRVFVLLLVGLVAGRRGAGAPRQTARGARLVDVLRCPGRRGAPRSRHSLLRAPCCGQRALWSCRPEPHSAAGCSVPRAAV